MTLRTCFGRFAFLGAVLLMAAPWPAGTARAADIVGDSEWDGEYRYSSGDRPGVGFHMWLHVSSDGAVSGRTEEIATFGKGPSPKLFATIAGTLQGSSISFTKTYDGTNGVSHSVGYSGSIGDDGRTMYGSWRTNLSGSFQARMVSQARVSCIKANPTLRKGVGNYVLWNFVNSCGEPHYVSVCAEYGNNVNNLLGGTVPPHDSIDITLLEGSANLSWGEGTIPCPHRQ
jgi:hypothetical protein